MANGSLGKTFSDGEVIITEGDIGDCMYVVQEGQVEVFTVRGGKEVRLAVRGEGEFIGEMAIFEREVRSANVRALGPVRLLTIDRKNFLRRIHEDPSLAFRVVETMSRRIRELSEEVARMKGADETE